MLRCSTARNVGGLFPPGRVFFDLGPEHYSPLLLRKLVHFGGNSRSFSDAATNVKVGMDRDISDRHIETLTERIGTEMAAERDRLAGLWEENRMPAPTLPNAPRAVAVSTDDGKLRVRADDQGPGVHEHQWKNFKCGLLMTLLLQKHDRDPQPKPPSAFTEPLNVGKLVRELGHNRGNPMPASPTNTDETSKKPKQERRSKRKRKRKRTKRKGKPQILVRSCIATHTNREQFGAMLAAEAHMRRFFDALYGVFLGDGDAGNWTIQEMYFPFFIPLLDFVHLMEHLVVAAKAAKPDDWWSLYLQLVHLAWAGKSAELLGILHKHARRIGAPPDDASDSDPKKLLAGAIGYVDNNRDRMNYPRARRLGLPVTTSHIESLINEFNIRVKSAGKFWCGENVEAVLQVRAGRLSETNRSETFWSTRASRHAGRIRAPRRLTTVQ